jgi:hypothetical protein
VIFPDVSKVLAKVGVFIMLQIDAEDTTLDMGDYSALET